MLPSASAPEQQHCRVAKRATTPSTSLIVSTEPHGRKGFKSTSSSSQNKFAAATKPPNVATAHNCSPQRALPTYVRLACGPHLSCGELAFCSTQREPRAPFFPKTLPHYFLFILLLYSLTYSPAFPLFFAPVKLESPRGFPARHERPQAFYARRRHRHSSISSTYICYTLQKMRNYGL